MPTISEIPIPGTPAKAEAPTEAEGTEDKDENPLTTIKGPRASDEGKEVKRPPAKFPTSTEDPTGVGDPTNEVKSPATTAETNVPAMPDEDPAGPCLERFRASPRGTRHLQMTPLPSLLLRSNSLPLPKPRMLRTRYQSLTPLSHLREKLPS